LRWASTLSTEQQNFLKNGNEGQKGNAPSVCVVFDFFLKKTLCANAGQIEKSFLIQIIVPFLLKTKTITMPIAKWSNNGSNHYCQATTWTARRAKGI